MLLVLQDERRDGAGFDPRSCRHVGYHLVLEGQTKDGPPFCFRNPRDACQHGRFAGAGDALDDHRAIGRGDNHGGRTELTCVQRERCGGLKAARCFTRWHDGLDRAFASFDPRQNLRLGLERLRRRDHAEGPVVSPYGFGDQRALLEQGADTALDGF